MDVVYAMSHPGTNNSWHEPRLRLEGGAEVKARSVVMPSMMTMKKNSIILATKKVQ